MLISYYYHGNKQIELDRELRVLRVEKNCKHTFLLNKSVA